MSVDDTLKEREETHGKFEQHAFTSQWVKSGLRGSQQWNRMSNTQREALEMIAHKIARILNGNPNHKDHWHDIAGYATLVEKELSDG